MKNVLKSFKKNKKKTILITGIISLLILMVLFIPKYGVIYKSANVKKSLASNDLEYTSLYSKTNAPEFYGMTKAVIQKDSEFDLSKSYLRIFAKDFEDGDLTSKIVVTSNNVDTTTVGSYEVSYEVIDSDNNKTTLIVPVEVVDDGEDNYYERTLYSLTSISDGNITGPRGKYMDRQITGFMLEEGTTINIKLISGSDIQANIYANSAGYSSQTINTTGIDITASRVSTVFFRTPYDTTDETVIGITINKDDIIDMPYYHYKDDEAKFREYWSSLYEKGETVGLVEGYSIAYYILPTDKPTTGFTAFGTIDKGLEFFDKLTNEYDELLGYEYDATEAWNQNVKMKYFICGGGANNGLYAYFTNEQVVLAGSSTPSSNAFSNGWGIMHEIGHGYQGAALKEDSGMGLLEVSGNILAYYAQTKSYFADQIGGNWLGEISNKEISVNNARLNGKTFRNLGAGDKLYVLVNLLDTYDYKNDYSYLASMSRKLYSEGKINNYNLADRYVLMYHELYGVNVSSYFEAWGEKVSQSVKDAVKNDESLLILSDAVNDSSLTDTIQSDLSLEGKYSLVLQSTLDKYELKSIVKIHINIDDIDNIKGKYIYLNGGSDSYKVEITSNDLEVEVNAGAYQVITPIPKVNYYTYNSYYTVNAISKETAELTIDYTINNNDSLSFDTKFAFSGQLGVFSTITFDSENIIVDVNGNYTHGSSNPDTDYVNVKVYDENDNLVFESHQVGSTYLTKAHDEIPYKVGYKLVVFHQEGVSDGRYTITHTLTGKTVTDLTHVSGDNTYYIGEYGLYQGDEYDYNLYLDLIDSYATKLVNDLSEDEISDKNLKRDEKAVLLRSIDKLKDSDKEVYLAKYNYIFNGHSATLNTTTLTLEQGSSSNLYKLLKGEDEEDGTFTLNKNNFTYDNFSTEKSGTYVVNYTLKDLDDNVTTGAIVITVEAAKKEVENVTNSNNTTSNSNNNNNTSNNIDSITNNTTTENNSTTTNKVESNKTTTNKNTSDSVIKTETITIINSDSKDNTSSKSNSSSSTNKSNTKKEEKEETTTEEEIVDDSTEVESYESVEEIQKENNFWILLSAIVVMITVIICVVKKQNKNK